MVSLARKTLLYEWRRFLPAILAVGFATLLQLLQAALVLGIFGGAAVYVTGSDADIWIGYPGTQSVDQGRPIDADVASLLHMDRHVGRVEPFDLLDGDWRGGHGTGGISVFVSGIRTRPGSMMFSQVLTPRLRARLAYPESVIVDPADLEKLGVRVGDTASINGHLVRVVGTAHGLRALGGVNVLTSLETARTLDPSPADTGGPTYLVARLDNPSNAAAVVARLRGHDGFGPYQAWTASQFARRSVLFWLFDTGAGAGVLFLAAIVFAVGAIITSQALMAAVVASINEYATLNALGVGKRSLRGVVLEQAFWVGACGLVGAGILTAVMVSVARSQSVPVVMNAPVMLACLALIMVLVGISGLFAMRSIRRADPATLLR
ncbi:ABC transporter permease [Oleiagrimonas sp. C23AA]|uniref:ABC transporter permease n=1 Tax=Oleiagrimonas sp. C23AA TaxID=2719047 RepID=UPI001423BE00|nr:ABC transporter permease [Oleiagrimonas sp. C23AA]NII11116.1 ABC transporter permease [Oleiagrimonas sp. C23AA]